MLREGLRAWLTEEDWVGQVVEAKSVQEALREATERKVDVVVMDVVLPDGDGIDATVKLARIRPDVKVLVLTYDGDENLVHRAIKAGALGYARKDTKPEDLVAILRVVACGCFILGPEVGTGFLADVRRAPVRLPPPFDRLNEREREILSALVSTGSAARRSAICFPTISTASSAWTTSFRQCGSSARAASNGRSDATPGRSAGTSIPGAGTWSRGTVLP